MMKNKKKHNNEKTEELRQKERQEWYGGRTGT
jgi:hypothetical protein